MRATDEQVTFVRALPDGFFYGGNHGIYLLDEKSADGSRKGSSYRRGQARGSRAGAHLLLLGRLPAGAGGLHGVRSQPPLVARRGARRHRVHRRRRLRLHSYRYFFAFDAKSGKLRWAYAHPRVDVVSADDAGPSIVFAAADGEVGVLDADHRRAAVALQDRPAPGGRELRRRRLAPAHGGRSEPPQMLKTLEPIVWDPDARFTAVKVFAVGAIGAQSGKDADAALLKIVRAPKEVPPVGAEARGRGAGGAQDGGGGAAVARGAQAALRLPRRQPRRGVDVLARAVAALDAQRGGAAPVAHLPIRPRRRTRSRTWSARWSTLGGKDARRALRELLLTYRADPRYFGDPAPLTIAGEALLKLGDAEDRRTVEFVATDKWTISPVAKYLQKALEKR